MCQATSARGGATAGSCVAASVRPRWTASVPHGGRFRCPLRRYEVRGAEAAVGAAQSSSARGPGVRRSETALALLSSRHVVSVVNASDLRAGGGGGCRRHLAHPVRPWPSSAEVAAPEIMPPGTGGVRLSVKARRMSLRARDVAREITHTREKTITHPARPSSASAPGPPPPVRSPVNRRTPKPPPASRTVATSTLMASRWRSRRSSRLSETR